MFIITFGPRNVDHRCSSLQYLQILKDLYPQPWGYKTYLSPALWTLSRSEKKKLWNRIRDFRGPDGY